MKPWLSGWSVMVEEEDEEVVVVLELGLLEDLNSD